MALGSIGRGGCRPVLQGTWAGVGDTALSRVAAILYWAEISLCQSEQQGGNTWRQKWLWGMRVPGFLLVSQGH